MKNIKSILITAGLLAVIVIVGYSVQQTRANWPTLSTGITTTTATVVAKQVETDLIIKRNLILTVRALTTNTAAIRIAGTEAGAHSTSSAYFSLYPGESLGLFVENANDVWFGALIGEGLEYITEFE